jgi:ABC-type transport system involved in multi-copper enzyme maturation permease subunit
MTASAVAADRDVHVDRVESEPVTLPRAVRSEWIKFKTLRSSWALLGGATFGMVAIGLIVAYNTRHLTANLQLDDLSPSATLQGYHLGELLIGALGALFVTGEYSTGMIRSTFAAVPKRTPVLWAKLCVFVTVVAVVMIPVSVLAFTSAQAVISHTRVGYSLGDPGVARIVIGTGIYLALIGVIAASIGWLIRNTAGAIVTYIAVILVLPGILGGLLGSWGRHVAEYLPNRAGASFSTTFVGAGPNLKPWTGLAVLCLWVIALLAIAIVQLRHRDA